jgi:hypothetical protein
MKGSRRRPWASTWFCPGAGLTKLKGYIASLDNPSETMVLIWRHQTNTWNGDRKLEDAVEELSKTIWLAPVVVAEVVEESSGD